MLPTNIDSLGIGAILAYLKLFNKNLVLNILKNNMFFLFSFLILLINYKWGTVLTKEIFNKLLVAILSFYLIGKASLDNFSSFYKVFLENKTIAYLGKISFGIYIYHILIWGEFGPNIISIWSKIINDDSNTFGRNLIVFVSVSIITFLIASVSYELYEKKILAYKNKFGVRN